MATQYQGWHQLGESLKYRPLLPVATAITLGCLLGPKFALRAGETGLKSPILLLPLATGIVSLLVACRSWRFSKPTRARVALCFGLMAVFMIYAAHRILPPTNDVSILIRGLVPEGPQKRVPVQLQGYVADFPQRSDFDLSFPLECVNIATGHVPQPALSGRVWIEAPLDTKIEVGDAISLNTELADLPRAGNAGERTSPISYILDNCWCLARVKKACDIRTIQAAARYPLERWIVRLRQHILVHYEHSFAGSSTATG